MEEELEVLKNSAQTPIKEESSNDSWLPQLRIRVKKLQGLWPKPPL
jgi:hypothetical protein